MYIYIYLNEHLNEGVNKTSPFNASFKNPGKARAISTSRDFPTINNL